MRKPDFRLIPNFHTILVALAFLVLASSIMSSFLPEFIFQITTQVETTFDMEKEGEKDLNELEDDQKQILPECDLYFYSVIDNIFPVKSVGFPGLYALAFTPPPELI